MTPLSPQSLRQLPPRQQVDELRKALRSGQLSAELARPALPEWIETFRSNAEPGFQVLVLELLAPLEHPSVVELARSALEARGDGVRLSALRMILDRHPGELGALDRRFREDDSLEIRLLLAERLHTTQPTAAVDRFFDILSEEALGPRELHALERAIEFLVDETTAPGLTDRLTELKNEVRDPEGFVDWGISRLEARGEGGS